MMTKIAMTTVPKIARRLEKKALTKSSLRLRVLTPGAAWVSCCICASAISVPHPGVQYRVEHIHEQVDKHEEQGPVEDDALDRSVVPGGYRIVGVQSYPGPGEDRLRYDRTPHEQSHLQSDHRYRRQHGISQGVFGDHPPRDDTLGPGRPDVILVHDLQHAGACHPHDHGHWDRPERQGGHYEVQQPVPEAREVQREQRIHEHEPGYGGDASRRVKATRKRQELQVYAEDHDQDHGQPEDGHAYPRERQDRGRLVEQRVLPDGRDYAYRNPHENGDEHRERREFEGGWQPHHKLGSHRPAGDYGVAQVAPDRVLEEEPVLDEDGLVETHVLPDLLDLLLGGLLAQHDLGRVSGDGAHHEEHDDRHPEQYRDDLQDPASDVLRQSLDLRPDTEGSQRYAASTVRLRF